MTNPDEKQKPIIKTRPPKKVQQGTFDRIRKLPHPVEEILGLTDMDSPPLSPSDGQTIPISPAKDFNKRANSLERDALPAGLFPGSSKKLYDALYLRTRGAIKPCRTVRATKKDLTDWSGIQNRKTIDTHLRYLTACGLLERNWELGNVEGYLFEVHVPEETPLVDRGGQGDRGGQSEVPVKSDIYDFPKTVKTNTNDDDDEDLSEFVRVFREGARKIVGGVSGGERERWGDLARVIITELSDAAAKTAHVSSVPAFFAAHLRRRFARDDKRHAKPGSNFSQSTPPEAVEALPPPADRRLTADEVAEQSHLIADLIDAGYTAEQADAQFAASFHAADWAVIRQRLHDRGHEKASEAAPNEPSDPAGRRLQPR
ncbi:MAG: hypothetical protein M3R15_01075 [Acidobacteriota bacterium]|nr:hypothetical protein [Acidobacteriota bacterium]